MLDENHIDRRRSLSTLTDKAVQYFKDAEGIAKEEVVNGLLSLYGMMPNDYWNQLPPNLQSTANTIVDELLPVCASIAELANSSSLTGSEDVRDIKKSTKKMRAALRLRSYNFYDADVLHDEGTVLGFTPAKQEETQGLSPIEAKRVFLNNVGILKEALKLVEASPHHMSTESTDTLLEASKYKAGTAFVMMWMDPQHPELDDVLDTVRGVFKSFGIRAVRADDIEHEGLITDRIINEIQSAEFLFADLTGSRPNVYYEVGYAHALRKRVILFRKSGTGISFDLAGYNCPEYDNQRDLKEKLNKRLISITNRNPTLDE